MGILRITGVPAKKTRNCLGIKNETKCMYTKQTRNINEARLLGKGDKQAGGHV